MATGAKERYFDFPKMVIPLSLSLNKELLKDVVTKNDTVGVFGGSFSAILII
jgi:hypothetical protein